MNIVIRTIDRRIYYVKTPALIAKAQEKYNEISEKFCAANTRAISVELDTHQHSEQAIVLLCDNIASISLE